MDDLGGSISFRSSSLGWQSRAEDLVSFSAPSPVVERSLEQSHILQRKSNRATESINRSLKTLNNVVTGSPLATPVQYHSQTHSILDQKDTSLKKDDTPIMSVSFMDEYNTFRDVQLLQTPLCTTTLFSPKEESSFVSFSLKSVSPHDVQYVDHPIMQIGLNLMTSFHHHLHSMNNPSQVIDLMEALEKTCAAQIEHLKSLENSKQNKEILVELKLERDTWQLVKALYSDRLSQENDENEDVSSRELIPRTDKQIIDDYFMSCSVVRQAQVIVDWLERIAGNELEDFPTKIKYYADSVSWDSTLHDIKYRLNPGYIVTEMDPDAKTRQKKHLSELDEKDEQSLSKHLFECIRSGELDKAQLLCMQCGQPWRAAILNGWKLYHDPNLNKDIDDELEEVEGNPTRDLWKLSCWDLTRCSTFSDHDKAIYSALSGNISYLLKVCQSWYDFVWAYYKVMVDVLVEQKIRSSKRYPNDYTFAELPKQYWDAILIPELVFQEIEACPSLIIKKQCLNYYHLAQKHFILGSLDDLIDEMHYWLTQKTNGHLLRFMAHVVLFVKTISLSCDETKCHDILEAFIKVLVSHRLNNLVALYCSYLPQDRQVVCYSDFLSGITESNEQKKCLELASECGLDISAVTRRIVETTRQNNAEEMTSDSLAQDVDINESDKFKINSLDWLLYDPSHREEAIFQANALIREFLAVNKHRAAVVVFTKIPSNSIEVLKQNWVMKNGSVPLSKKLINDIHEHFCIKAYLEAIDSFNVWFEIFHHLKPTPPTQPTVNEFKEKLAYERKTEKYKDELDQWNTKLNFLVSDVETKIYNVLLFVKGGWMVDEEHENEVSIRSQQMKRLRQLCIPKICFLLHSVLHSTGNYKKSLQIADVVASDNHCLYNEFTSEELKHFLHLMHTSALEQVQIVDQDSFGYPLTS